MYALPDCSVTLQDLFEKIPPTLFDGNIDSLLACQILLVYPVAKFDKKYLHRNLTLCNRKIAKARSAVKISQSCK